MKHATGSNAMHSANDQNRTSDRGTVNAERRSTQLLDGVAFNVLAAQLTQCVHLASVTSTMDYAHALAAAGAPSGTLVVADVQTSGRGRGGKRWVSEAGQGLWCTLIERAPSTESLSVLSLRVGLVIAEVAQAWCAHPVQLKLPNHVLVRNEQRLAKLSGVLVEARWRESSVEWVAIGIGVNLRPPRRDASADPAAALAADPVAERATEAVAELAIAATTNPARKFEPAYLTAPVSRAAFLTALMPRLRAVAQLHGALTDAEHHAWTSRDAMRGQTCVQPEEGVVDGINHDGSLRIRTADGSISAHRSGSLILFGEPDTC